MTNTVVNATNELIRITNPMSDPTVVLSMGNSITDRYVTYNAINIEFLRYSLIKHSLLLALLCSVMLLSAVFVCKYVHPELMKPKHDDVVDFMSVVAVAVFLACFPFAIVNLLDVLYYWTAPNLALYEHVFKPN